MRERDERGPIGVSWADARRTIREVERWNAGLTWEPPKYLPDPKPRPEGKPSSGKGRASS